MSVYFLEYCRTGYKLFCLDISLQQKTRQAVNIKDLLLIKFALKLCHDMLSMRK